MENNNLLSNEKLRRDEATRLAQEMISKLSLTEKIGQLSQFGTSIYEDKIVYYEDHYEEGKIGSYLTISGAKVVNMLQKECAEKFPTYIPLLFAEDVIHGYKTTLPIPLAQSCSWNPNVAKVSAQVAAKEAYAAGIRWTFSPMVDIARDPRWGRIAEGYGEDTYLCSRFAEATVRGYQGDTIGEKYHVMSCMKHFIGYGACMGGKDYNEVEMSQQTLMDVYLPPFQAGFAAGSPTVMSAFNTLNGVPCTGSEYLLKDILRDRCGFKGFVVSDAGAVHELVVHGYAKNGEDAAYKSIKAGINMLMAGDLYNDYLPGLIEKGAVTEDEIDDALLPILEQKILWNLFQHPYTDETEEEKIFFCDEHIKISRETGRECIVLLENDGILPLDLNKKIALIGPFADDKEHILGTWACKKDAAYTVSIKEGLERLGIALNFAKGCDVLDGNVDELKEAVDVAGQSDIAIVVIGESGNMSGEAQSKANLDLPECHRVLLDAIIETGTPVVLLITAGRPMIVEQYRDKVSALAFIWHLGTGTGDAVADILSGAYDASGRLSVSVPRSVGQLPVYYNHSNTGRPYKGEGWVETRYIDESPLPSYSFGYGLSYTTFNYSDIRLSAKEMGVDGEITISCKILNTGERGGYTVAQLYVRDLVGSVVRPVKQLKGFEKRYLEAGESCTVTFTLKADDLAFHNERLDRVIEPGKFHVWIGQHSNDNSLYTEFCIK